MVSANKKRWAWILILALGMLCAAAFALNRYTAKGKLDPSGGLYFPWKIQIAVPRFAQDDPRWRSERLGETESTLAAEGCAVASAAMVLASYGAPVDPGSLNAFLHRTGGYAQRAWLRWEAAAEFPPRVANHVYEDDASYWLIDSNLLRGNPVIVRMRFPQGPTHFVVICGKEGFDYLICDPGSGGDRGVYPLRDLGLPIEALRFYRKIE